ncbi:MAG: hypothetical protein ABIH70_08750 [Chloroflexota bacterium]
MYIGLIIIVVLFVLGIAALTYYKTKWGRATRKEARGRSDKIEEERKERESDKGKGNG